jgi:2-polyprenyl-3-methyl-5-hydroxy-6-metoxy-1,4-benzoquinol methylase
MNEVQRAQVLANAKYLRQVRPVDPEAITDYVNGEPHPDAVRRTLREEALDLGLRERDDGSFVPVGDDPISVRFDGVDALPAGAERALEDRLVDIDGPGWPDGDTGDALRARIRDIKSRYFQGETVEYDQSAALGYAIYHLPATYASAAYVLAELAEDGLIPSRLRVLDVGAGVGGPALAIKELFAGAGLVEYTAVEPSAAADVLEAIVGDADSNFHLSLERTTAESFDPDSEYDLILCSNVLSELERPTATLGRYLEALRPDGSVVAIAPADRDTAIGLRQIERSIESTFGATVYAPTGRLWPGTTPASTSWSFDVKPDLQTPAFQRRLDTGERGEEGSADRPGSGEYVNVDVQYAFSILRRDGRRRVEYTPDESSVARMADMEAHVTDRIDCVGIKLSHDLSAGDGGNRLYLVGDGSQRIDHFAVRTGASTLNESLVLADYGDLLHFENVLVLWNDDEDAYNLVVDGETIVDRRAA